MPLVVSAKLGDVLVQRCVTVTIRIVGLLGTQPPMSTWPGCPHFAG